MRSMGTNKAKTCSDVERISAAQLEVVNEDELLVNSINLKYLELNCIVIMVYYDFAGRISGRGNSIFWQYNKQKFCYRILIYMRTLQMHIVDVNWRFCLYVYMIYHKNYMTDVDEIWYSNSSYDNYSMINLRLMINLWDDRYMQYYGLVVRLND